MTTAYIVRILIASLLGGIIGLDREYRAKDAGFRTHFLVALGSALFMVVSQYGFEGVRTLYNMSVDPSRIASQVVTGIGFIGAGTIIFQKHMLKGLTTAAGIWCTAAIGLACGASMYLLAAVATALTLICLEAFNYILHSVGGKNISIRLKAPSKENIHHILETIEQESITLGAYSMEKKQENGSHYYIAQMELRVRKGKYTTRLMQLLRDFDGVSIESME